MYWRGIEHAKDWRLRAQLTHIRKALKGCAAHPNGMSEMIAEDLNREEKQIRAEIERRKTSVTS